MNTTPSSAENPIDLKAAPADYGFGVIRNQLRELVDSSGESEEYLQLLSTTAQQLAAGFLLVGDQADNQLAAGNDSYRNDYLLFSWGRDAQLYLRLWRDTLLQNEKAKVLRAIQLQDADQLADLKARSLKQLLEALQEWEEKIDRDLNISVSEQEKARFNWSKENHPWQIYRTQLVAMIDQCQELATDHSKQLAIADQLQRIRLLLTSNAKHQLTTLQAQLIQVRDLIDLIEEEQASIQPKIGRITKEIADLEALFPGLQHERDLRQDLNKLTQGLPAQERIYTSSRQGYLQYKDINFRTNVQQWVETEILPVLYETWEEAERAEAQMLLALANVRNRLSLHEQLNKEQQDNDPEIAERSLPNDLTSPLVSFLHTAKLVEESLTNYVEPLCEQLERELRLERAYDESSAFLPRTALQASLRQIQGAQTALWTRFRRWLSSRRKQIMGWLDQAKREDQLSLSEKIVRAVESRKKKPPNPTYANIFITKGYVGESFFAGREAELDRMHQLVDSWNNGYRGAVLLTGRRQSGKSLFGELVTNRFFAEELIRLSPGQSTIVNGRRLELGYELRPALDFIKKHTISQRPAIWIDDLELWRDRNIQLGQNVQQLQHFIDAEAQRIFFLVSCGNAVYHRLDRIYNIDKTFQARIQMNRMPLNEMVKAIYIRHGATHEDLQLENGDYATDTDFRNLVRMIHRLSDGNIGDALRLWAAGIHDYASGGVVASPITFYTLPAFLEADAALLLASLIRERQADEYHLRQLFGPGFPERFRYVLKRLQGVGILQRLDNGQLQIEPAIVNDLGQLLQRNGYLSYDQ